MAEPYETGKPRYNTEITNEYYYKYRLPTHLAPGSLFYGNDSDMLYKTVTGTTRGATIGLGVGLFSFFKYDKSGFVFSRALERSFKHGMPWVIAGAAYGVGTSTSGQIRKKDGPLNHAVGGYAAGTMIGAWYKSTKLGVWSGLLFAIVGSTWKLMVDNDMMMKGPYVRQRSFNMYRRGWFIERPHHEGVQDGDSDDSFKRYRPDI